MIFLKINDNPTIKNESGKLLPDNILKFWKYSEFRIPLCYVPFCRHFTIVDFIHELCLIYLKTNRTPL